LKHGTSSIIPEAVPLPQDVWNIQATAEYGLQQTSIVIQLSQAKRQSKHYQHCWDVCAARRFKRI